MMLIKNYYILFYIYIFINILFILNINGINYCNIECIDAKIYKNDSIFHIKCLRPDCKLSGPCKNSPTKWIGLTTNEKTTLLNLHNELRNSLALGKVPHKPTATNMYRLEWDNEVADIAQCWANACVITHDYGCRDVRGNKVGQNMGMEAPNIDNASIQSLVTYWFGEAADYKYTDLYEGIEKTGHFTQMAWATTKYLGCGKIIFHDDKYKLDTINLVCNYMPEGNVIGQSVYKSGDPASACPAGSKKDKKLQGLCEFNAENRRRLKDPHRKYSHDNEIGYKRENTDGTERSTTLQRSIIILLCLRILHLII